jgi:hypothetical protein
MSLGQIVESHHPDWPVGDYVRSLPHGRIISSSGLMRWGWSA